VISALPKSDQGVRLSSLGGKPQLLRWGEKNPWAAIALRGGSKKELSSKGWGGRIGWERGSSTRRLLHH